jgi:hypothetical protein
LQTLNDFIQHKYRILKESIENDNGKANLNKVEANIPMIKKIELMLSKEMSMKLMNYGNTPNKSRFLT